MNRGHSSGSSTRTEASVVDRPDPAGRPSPAADRATGRGMANGSPSRAARSRATPAMHQASGRLASTATSKTTSGSIPSAVGQRLARGGARRRR